jgi:hypothetical protein
MSGLLRRIRRPGAAEENRTEPIAPPEPAHGSDAPTAPDGERSPAPAVRADGRPLPAGVAPEDLERRAGTGRRGKVRRRARFLRRARELALRDLGGLVYEAHRREQDSGALVKEKVQQLAVLDAELLGLETELGTPRGDTVLREPGVGGTCPRCGELHASNARFCAACGLDLTAAPAEPEAVSGGAEAAPAEATAEPAPAEGKAAAAEEAAKPAAAEGAAAASEATAAEPAPADGAAEPAAAEPAPADGAAEPAAAEPAPAEAEAAPSEQPTVEETAQAANGRAKTKAQPSKAETDKPPA